MDCRVRVRQATKVGFCASLRWVDRLRIFILLQFETVSIILAQALDECLMTREYG